jgi:hypothetical protein
MTKRHISGAIMAAFIVGTEIILPTRMDVARCFTMECFILGLLGLVFVAYEMPRYMWALGLPLILAVVLASFNWHGAYTINELSTIAGLTMLMLFVSQCSPKWVLRALAATVLIQIAYTYIGLPWREFYAECYQWGLWRNILRYATDRKSVV